MTNQPRPPVTHDGDGGKADENLPQHALARLATTIAARRDGDPSESYVARLHAGGMPLASRKLGEEAIETVVAALSGDDAEVIAEAADLMFHLMVLLDLRGIALEDVLTELARREGLSGLAEKAARASVSAS